MSIIDMNGDSLRNYTQNEVKSMLKESHNLYCPFCNLVFHCESMRSVDEKRDEHGRLLVRLKERSYSKSMPE